MPLRITIGMVIFFIQFLVQMMEEKLSFGSSFKKHSFINTTSGAANEEAVNDHRLLHRATILYTTVQGLRSIIIEKPHDCYCMMVSVPKESLLKFVHFWCKPKRWIREEKVESKDVHLPSKKHPSPPKMGVSCCRPQPGRHSRHTHPVCRLVSHIPSRPPVTLNVPAYKHLKEWYNWVAKSRTV